MLDYRHLPRSWVVTKEGGVARAAERQDMAVQTICAQVRELEKSLSHRLLKPLCRGVALTEAGQAAPRNPNLRLSSENHEQATAGAARPPNVAGRPQRGDRRCCPGTHQR